MRTLALALAVSGLVGGAALASGCSSGGAQGECVGESGDALKVCAAGATVSGIDVSYYQGNVNWTQVKSAGRLFAIVRVSDGKNTLDSQFANNWKNTKSAGVIRGAYQFFRPSQDATAQADLLIAQINKNGGLLPGDLPPVLDLESTDGIANATVVARAKEWLARVEAGLGVKPLVYTAAFMSTTIGTNFSGYTLWVANYGTTCPTMPSGWNEWAFWQNSDSGSVAGVAGNVDTDVFNGTLSDLLKLTVKSKDAGPTTDGGAPPPPPPPPPAGVSGGGEAMGAGGGSKTPPAPPVLAPPDPCAP